MKNRILLWGAGNRTKVFLERDLFGSCEIAAIVDSFKSSDTFMGYQVIQPEQISDYMGQADYIVISNQFYLEITVQILALGIPMEKIIITDHAVDMPYADCFERAGEIIPSVYETAKNSTLRAVKLNERDYSDNSTLYKDDSFRNPEYRLDYFRYRTFEFAAEEIHAANIPGAMAELGVFRGTFSALINKKFADRKLYLFDTFEGFNEEEAESEKRKGRCSGSFITSHKETSVDMMLKNLPYPEQAVVCKGFFPESVTDEAEKETYAFVSLDVDFEESTYNGLKFFYPRLSEGGYIFIHDYNTYFLEGVKRAVERYEMNIGYRLKKIPIADRAGTLIIMK